MEGRLMVSEDRGFGYGGWLSPSVFYIPVPAEDETSANGKETAAGGKESSKAGTADVLKTAHVTLETRGEPPILEEQFYALDLDRLSEAAERIRERSAAVRDLAVANGKISCTADAAEGQALLLSVPASKGWTVFVNGKKTKTDGYEGCFMKVPLVMGENHITMQYRVPGMAAGAVMTLIGAAGCAAVMLADIKKQNKREYARKERTSK